MTITAKLSAYGAAVALLATGAYAAGTAVGPLSPASAVGGHGAMPDQAPVGAGHGDAHSGTVAETDAGDPAPRPAPQGLDEAPHDETAQIGDDPR